MGEVAEASLSTINTRILPQKKAATPHNVAVTSCCIERYSTAAVFLSGSILEFMPVGSVHMGTAIGQGQNRSLHLHLRFCVAHCRKYIT